MSIIAIAAIDENRAIAKDGNIPWDISEDVEHYLNTVEGHPVVMSRPTSEYATKGEGIDAVTDELNVIITRNEELTSNKENIVIVHTVDDALELARQQSKDVYVLGGSEIYEQMLPYTDKLVISHIEGDYDGDTFFPEWNSDDWEVTKTETFDEFEVKYYTRK